MENVEAWGLYWALFMVLIFTPALFVAPYTEGVSFHEALDQVGMRLNQLGYPGFLVAVLYWPVTLVAEAIPNNSGWPLIFLQDSLQSYPFLAVFIPLFLMFSFEYPYYREHKYKIDPDWYVKEHGIVYKQAFFRPRPFSHLVVILAICTFSADFVYGKWLRDPFADSYIGKVYLINTSMKKIPLDITMKIRYFTHDPINDRKVGINGKAIKIEFSGRDVAVLNKVGINERFFASEQVGGNYLDRVCEINKKEVFDSIKTFDGKYRGYTSKTYHYTITDDHGQQQECPKSMYFSIKDFDHIDFGIDKLKSQMIVVAEMKRDSHIGFLQRLLMQL
ncbi:hypothetical protein [Pseudomonas putida]|uniref:hypothetical protein n=1 Tax=Pseudomonas putida TaxID=303 RepID=UPI002166C4A2|nr:hypothetical protein [Pseudomonas putida]MCS4061713.1 hypothetical protein [Pseudomonas putida]